MQQRTGYSDAAYSWHQEERIVRRSPLRSRTQFDHRMEAPLKLALPYYLIRIEGTGELPACPLNKGVRRLRLQPFPPLHLPEAKG